MLIDAAGQTWKVPAGEIRTENGTLLHRSSGKSWVPFAEGRNDNFKKGLPGDLAGKYGKSVAQIILCWLTQRDIVVIPKSVRKERIEENFNIFDFRLTADDMSSIETLDQMSSSFFDHRDPAIVKSLAGRRLDI